MNPNFALAIRRLGSTGIVIASFLLPLCFLSGALAVPDKEFDLFWSRFKAAVKKNDKNAVAGMTKLPYMLNSKSLSKEQFIAQYPKIFRPSVRKCLITQKPQKDKDCYMVFCGEEIFVFGKTSRGYAFMEIGAND